MAILVGNAGVITIEDDAGSEQTVAEVRSYTIETTADTIETSKMGTGQRTYVKGLSTFSVSADVYFDPTHLTTIDINPTVGSVGATNKIVGLKVFPTGSGTAWNGDIVITGYSVTASFDGLIEATISFQGTGAVAYS
jgi:predicted secreted protein